MWFHLCTLFVRVVLIKERCLLQHTATLCNTLQHSATHCNTLQHTATHCNTLRQTYKKGVFVQFICAGRTQKREILLQHTATHCHTLQHTATHCNRPTQEGCLCNLFVRLVLIKETYFMKRPLQERSSL